MVVNLIIEKPKEPQNSEENTGSDWPQIFVVFVAALTALNNSILYNWTSPSIPILIASDEYPGITIELASYLTVISPVISILAAPIYGICLDRYGRKICLIASGIMFIAAWLCIIFTKSLYIFYLSRVLFGLGNAALLSILPVYISEVTTPKVRGKWGNLMACFLYLGQFVANAVGNFFDIKTTACILLSTPILFMVLFVFCPETPYYYILKNKPNEAEKSLKKLRRTENVKNEFDQLKLDLKRQLSETGTFKDCVKINSNRKALLIVGMARGLQQFSGISSFAAYNQYLFQEAGGLIDKGYASMIYASSLAVASFIASAFIDKLGRRKPMVISTIGCFIILLSLAIYFFLKDNNIIDVSSVSWYPLLGMVLYVTVYSLGLSLIPVLLIGEMFTTSIRSKAGTIITILSSVFMTLVNKVFQVLMSNFGLAAPFTLFAICCFIGIFLSYFYIPETKGKTLEEIQQMLKGNNSKAKNSL